MRSRPALRGAPGTRRPGGACRVGAQLPLAWPALLVAFGAGPSCGPWLAEAQATALSSPVAAFAGFGPSERWRISHIDPVTYGWAIGSLKFFSDTECSEDAEIAVASGDAKVEASGHHGAAEPGHAFDEHTWTEWRAQCYICEPGEAWIGVRFPEPGLVRCLQLWQIGRDEYRTSEIALQRWEASTFEWQTVLRGTGMEGGRWDRIRFVKCADLKTPSYGTVEVTNNGFYPSEGRFSCRGARMLTGLRDVECRPDGTWNILAEASLRCWSLMEGITIIFCVVVLELFAFAAYYWTVIVQNDEIAKPIDADSIFPEDQPLKWNNDIMVDAMERAQKQMRCCICCPCCRLADTWRGVGLLSYPWGAFITQVGCCCIPCIGAHMRGRIRARFQIYSSARFSDLAWWLLCCVFSAVQEAKHVDEMRLVSRRTFEKKEKEQADRHARMENIQQGSVMVKNKAALKSKRPSVVLQVGLQNGIERATRAPQQSIMGAEASVEAEAAAADALAMRPNGSQVSSAAPRLSAASAAAAPAPAPRRVSVAAATGSMRRGQPAMAGRKPRIGSVLEMESHV